MSTPTQTAWDDAQTQAFETLLGQSLDFCRGVSFGVYYACGDLSLELFQEGFDAGLLARGEIVAPPFQKMPVLGELFEGWDLIAPRWTIDLGRSIFISTEGEDFGVPGFGSGLTGTAFGRALAAERVRPEDLYEAYPLALFRVRTDGSLLDAMRTVTGADDPARLTSADHDGDVEPRWREALAAVAHDGLRGHLRNFCRTEQSARADGAFYLGADDPSGGTLPYPVVAAWRIGEAQSWSAVVRLP